MADINSFREKLESLISKFEKDKSHYCSKVAAVDKIVFGLYRMTEGERKVIESR